MIATLLFFLFLLIASAIFSGTETAFTSLNEVKLLNEKKSGSVKILIDMLRNKRNVIAAILVGNNIVNTVLAVYAGAFFDEALVSSGILSANLGPMVASIVTILFLLIFGEVVPKHFGVTFTTLWMKAVSYPLWLVVRLLKPVTRAMDLFSRLMMNLLPFKGEDGDSVSIQELLIMARYSAKSGHIDEIERKLVVRATRFNDLEAKDVMIPRRQVFAVPETIGIDELRHEFNEHLLSRIPVYHETIDNVVGIFNFKELIKFNGRPDSFNILSFCHEPLYVPEKVSIGSLFEQMRVKQSHMAIIVDEFGATQGIITLEDIIERIFGLIHDEYDEEAVQPIVRISDTEFEVRGRASLDELAVAVGVRFPEEVTRKVDTVNGLITLLKGDFPEYRDEFEFQNLVFSVEKSQGMRASKVRIKLKH